jgi:hypothetical protein
MRWQPLCAVAAVSVLVGVAASACGDESDDASGDSSAAVGQQLESRWSLANDLALEQGSLAVADGTAVAVGVETDGSIGAYWSGDGFVWESADGFPELTDWPSAAVAGGPRGFVAIATRPVAAPVEPVIAFSGDGALWEVDDVQDLPEPLVSWLTEVVAGPDGFVVVGSSYPENSTFLWFSDDGRSWTDTDLPALDGPLAVANDGRGWMAVGGPGDDLTAPSTVFSSADGSRWTEVETENPPTIDAVWEYFGTSHFVGSDETWLLVPVEGGDRTKWASTDDGRSWTEVEFPASETVVHPDLITGVAVIDGAFVVVGSRDSEEVPDPPALFYSEDTNSWQAYRTVADYSGLDELGNEIVALDRGGNVFVWSP